MGDGIVGEAVGVSLGWIVGVTGVGVVLGDGDGGLVGVGAAWVAMGTSVGDVNKMEVGIALGPITQFDNGLVTA